MPQSKDTAMKRIVRALAPYSSAAAALIFSAAVLAAAPARAEAEAEAHTSERVCLSSPART
jgi:hypothetical protein